MRLQQLLKDAVKQAGGDPDAFRMTFLIKTKEKDREAGVVVVGGGGAGRWSQHAFRTTRKESGVLRKHHH